MKGTLNKVNRLSPCLFIFLFIFHNNVFASRPLLDSNDQSGAVQGQVIDKEIKAAVPNVRIRILGTSFEVITDKDGYFTISDVPVGSYTLEASCRFFITQSIPDVIVKSNRITQVQIELRLDRLAQKEEMTVTASYFSSPEQQSTSVANFSYEEIRRAAGSAGDVSRMISGLPSIARVNDMMNNLVVRGGSPAENAFFVDNIEIPNINHYPSLGSTAGAIGLLNVDFIRDVHFYSGGFSPIYGDRLSSVMDISFREGNRNEQDYQVDLSMMGLGLIAEGPLSRNKGSWIFSARRSYIDLLIKLMGSGVPVTWSDYQAKLTYDISPQNKLTFLGVLGVDESGTEKKDAIKDRESYYGGLDTSENTFGINWLAMWGPHGYSSTSVSQNFIKYAYDSFHTLTEDLSRKGEDSEQAFILRNINSFRLSNRHTFNFGIEIKYIVSSCDNFLGEHKNLTGNTIPAMTRELHESVHKYAAFFNTTWNLLSKVTLNLGLRTDYYTYNNNFHYSPRLSMSYKISDKTSIEWATGVFHQQLPIPLLLQSSNNRNLKDPVSYHYVLGFRHLLKDDIRLTIEVYDKEYAHFPLDPEQPSLFIFDEVYYGGFFSEHGNLSDTGRARSYGIEFMIQKKLADKLYGVISSSYFRTRYKGLDGLWRNRVYDNQYIFSIEGGYKPNKHWEIGMKWNYAGGAPYTPYDIEASTEANSGIYDLAHINAKRLPAYHTLNLRVDKRFYFGASNLIIYFSVWNVFNRKNVAAYYWNTIENKPDVVNQWGILPALGIEFEF